jgi:alpha-L-arabinofuranosidase
VLRLASDSHVPLLRWPGGDFVSYYYWRDGVGKADLRHMDAVACLLPSPAAAGRRRVIIAAVNVHLSKEIPLSIEVAGEQLEGPVEVRTLAFANYSAVASLAEPERFALQQWRVMATGGIVSVLLRPSSVKWIEVELRLPDRE